MMEEIIMKYYEDETKALEKKMKKKESYIFRSYSNISA